MSRGTLIKPRIGKSTCLSISISKESDNSNNKRKRDNDVGDLEVTKKIKENDEPKIFIDSE